MANSATLRAQAFVHEQSKASEYEWPEDSAVLAEWIMTSGRSGTGTSSGYSILMEDAGMKYMIFTSKHHDGFCMFDSKYTDLSIAKWAFKDNPRRDVARHVWDSFRQKGFMLGCYFSKPDWHSEWFWNPYFATPNRHPNYKKDRYPEWWQNFEDYVHNQVTELMTGYGPLDILWLDGGWVKGPGRTD